MPGKKLAQGTEPRMPSIFTTHARAPGPVVRTLAVLALLLPAARAGANPAAPATVNEELAITLFANGSPFAEDPDQVAMRLGLALESDADDMPIWTATDKDFCGIHVAEIRLFGAANEPGRGLEVNVINKGDFYVFANVLRFTSKRYKDRDKAMAEAKQPSQRTERDMDREFQRRFTGCEQRLTQVFTRLFGKPTRQTLRQGKRRRVDRWNWGTIAFLLDAVQDEYLMVRILPQAQADTGGKGKRVADRTVRKKLIDNVRKADNGDVWIADVPMVDQRGKGYCAVASAERVLRYFDIPVDSHELARLAGTDKFGGTSVNLLNRAVEAIAQRNNRGYRRIETKPSVRVVDSHIDAGMPIMWCMFVTAEMEQVAAERRTMRTSMPASQWRKQLRQKTRKTRKVQPDKTGGHLRLIVGYNRDTGEIAYSDSWGKRNDVFWLHEDEAARVSMPSVGMAVVVP